MVISRQSVSSTLPEWWVNDDGGQSAEVEVPRQDVAHSIDTCKGDVRKVAHGVCHRQEHVADAAARYTVAVVVQHHHCLYHAHTHTHT